MVWFSLLHKNDKNKLKVDLILGPTAVKYCIVMLDTLLVCNISIWWCFTCLQLM